MKDYKILSMNKATYTNKPNSINFFTASVIVIIIIIICIVLDCEKKLQLRQKKIKTIVVNERNNGVNHRSERSGV